MSGNGKAEEVDGWRDGYVLWNQRLLESFFSPASRGEEVWLQVDPDELDSLGRDLGGDEGFLRAVKAGPPWGTVTHGGPYVHGDAADVVQRVRGLVLQRWQLRRRPAGYVDPEVLSPLYANQNAPTYLPHLVALVRSSSAAGAAGFYSHLREALELPSGWGTQNLVALEHAWQDLQDWTRDTSGRFGRFVFRTLGGYERIGVPRSQSVMSRRDRDSLVQLFEQMGIRAGQNLTPRLIADIKQGVAGFNAFSSQFREAAATPAFEELVNARIGAVFEDWDGPDPSVRGRGARNPGTAAAEAGEARDQIELCLGLGEGNAFPWLIHWRVPALVESGSVFLENEGMRWEVQVVGTEPATTVGDESNVVQASARKALALSAEQAVKFNASSPSEDGGGEGIGEAWLPKAMLRALVWRFNPVFRRHELRESALPSNGTAYLLATRQNARRLADYLSRQEIEHQSFETTGLPDGWVLECITDCSRLTDEQRATLPDGRAGGSRTRAIRLVGGRSITRGSVRQYMSYDLPFVELDAPQGTKLQANGLDFVEEEQGGELGSAIRRFEIVRQAEGARSYDIVAINASGEIGTPTRLRVAANTGEAGVGEGGDFSLDPNGWPKRAAGGLRGVLSGDVLGNAVPAQRFAMRAPDFGHVVLPVDLERMVSNPAAMFLDTLAQQRSIAYGQARDQIARLQARAGWPLNPGAVLLELRGRGHLEIEINAEGHMARIYAVQPALYELAARNGDAAAYGVLGSLRLQQWQSLVEFGGGNALHHSRRVDSTLEHWRMLPVGRSTFSQDAAGRGFLVHDHPSLRIAEWAASVNAVRDSIGELAGESPPGSGRAAEQFTAASGRFRELQRQARVDDGVESQLFRLPDINSDRLKVHVLGTNGIAGRRYGYVRDSSWGKWIALGAFAKYVRERHGVDDASPWPIPYSTTDGTIWLPAHVRLPLVLERALTLCSGASPLLVEMNGVTGADGIELVRQADGKAIGRISYVYDQMARGKWLGFQWIPEVVAAEVARKVGGALAPT